MSTGEFVYYDSLYNSVTCCIINCVFYWPCIINCVFQWHLLDKRSVHTLSGKLAFKVFLKSCEN